MRISDWSSDVCSSDLRGSRDPFPRTGARPKTQPRPGKPKLIRDAPPVSQVVPIPATEARVAERARKSVVSGKSVSVRVDLGGRSIIKNTSTRETNGKKYKTIRTQSEHKQHKRK